MESFTRQWSDAYREIELFFCHELSARGGEGMGLQSGVTKILAQLESMRSSELRNLLLQDLQVDRATVDKILDRSELRELAKDLVGMQAVHQCRLSIFRIGVVIPVIAIFSVVLLLTFSKQYKRVRPYVRAAVAFFVDGDRFLQKIKLARMCSKHCSTFVAFLAMVLSLMLDIIIIWINISVGLSWILPHYSSWRQYLFFGFSLPVDADMIRSAITGQRQRHPFNSPPQSSVDKSVLSQTGGLGSSWRFDLGSFLTLIAFRWVGSKLDDFAAWQLHCYRTEQPDRTNINNSNNSKKKTKTKQKKQQDLSSLDDDHVD
jgi:hypothetical protein